MPVCRHFCLLRNTRNYSLHSFAPHTGELDQTTMDKMNSPKCGNPDFGTSGHQISARRKRFTTLGRTWPQNHLTWYLEGTTTDLSRNVIRSELAMAFQVSEKWGC